MPGKGRTVAIGVFAALLISSVAAALLCRQRIREEWLLFRLRKGDLGGRAAAATELGAMRSRRAVPDLVELLRAESPAASAAADALADIGRPAAVPVASLLKVESSPLRMRVAGILEKISPLPVECAGDIVDGLAGSNPRKAASLLKEIGPPCMPYVLKALSAPNDRFREAAARAVGLIGEPAREALPLLTALFLARDPQLRHSVICAVGSLGENARSAAPDLVERLEHDGHDLVREAAASSLGSIKATEPSAISALGKAAVDREQALPVRIRAIVALGLIGRPARAEVPRVLECLGAGKKELLGPAALTLSRTGLAGREMEAAPLLLSLFGEKGLDADARGAVALALGAFEAEQAAVVPALLRSAAEVDGLPPVWEKAREALVRLGAGAVPALEEAAASPDEGVQEAAMRALSRIGVEGARRDEAASSGKGRRAARFRRGRSPRVRLRLCRRGPRE